jgi:dihydroxy-acid dehydratase
VILGGSTNAVLHLIAIAHSVGIKLDLSDFQSVSDRVPFIADLKPSGKYVMEDVYKIGGIPSTCSGVFSAFPSSSHTPQRSSHTS